VRSIGEAITSSRSETAFLIKRRGLTLRPEGTAGCMRAGIEHSLFYKQPVQRLWYQGPMFRHERPQKGRYRQFHQIGVEAFGLPGPDIDAEMILMTGRLWRQLGLPFDTSGGPTLQLNSLGSPEARQVYRKALVAYLQRLEALDEIAVGVSPPIPARTGQQNPNAGVDRAAPRLLDYLDDESGRISRAAAWLDRAGSLRDQPASRPGA
jgi:histidyl-tRNA synthetase